MKLLLQLNRILLIILIIVFWGFKKKDESIPIYFPKYGVEIWNPKINDTLFYNKSSKEDFRFVFASTKGQCYCEKYVFKKLFEKGYFENSLDTLKRYVSGRFSSGRSTQIIVQRYFEPLKNGNWIKYINGKEIHERYRSGIKLDEKK